MEPVEYVFTIDAFRPDTLPMSRLAEYLAALAELVGSKAKTHFVRVDEGSAKLVHRIAFEEAPKVAKRLEEVRLAEAPKDAQRGYSRLDDLLANDNAVGELTGPKGELVIPFPGRLRPLPLTFASFWQSGTIEGEVVSIGGKDTTAHAILQDGGITYSGCSLNRELARQLARYLYAGKLRLFGRGKWERSPEGTWKLLEFKVDRFEALEEQSLSDTLTEIRNLSANEVGVDFYSELLAMRSPDQGGH